MSTSGDILNTPGGGIPEYTEGCSVHQWIS